MGLKKHGGLGFFETFFAQTFSLFHADAGRHFFIIDKVTHFVYNKIPASVCMTMDFWCFGKFKNSLKLRACCQLAVSIDSPFYIVFQLSSVCMRLEHGGHFIFSLSTNFFFGYKGALFHLYAKHANTSAVSFSRSFHHSRLHSRLQSSEFNVQHDLQTVAMQPSTNFGYY